MIKLVCEAAKFEQEDTEGFFPEHITQTAIICGAFISLTVGGGGDAQKLLEAAKECGLIDAASFNESVFGQDRENFVRNYRARKTQYVRAVKDALNSYRDKLAHSHLKRIKAKKQERADLQTVS